MYKSDDSAFRAQTNLLRRKSGGIIARCAACVDLPALWDGEVAENGRALAEVVAGLALVCRRMQSRSRSLRDHFKSEQLVLQCRRRFPCYLAQGG